MILQKSDLKLLGFDVLDAHITYVSPVELSDEVDESNYIVDLDFDVRLDDSGDIFIHTHISVNNVNAEFPCHVIDVDGASIFRIETSADLTPEIRDEFIRNSAIPIAFSNMRGYIQNVTSYSPIGTYILPLFSVYQLIESKNNQTQLKPKKRKK